MPGFPQTWAFLFPYNMSKTKQPYMPLYLGDYIQDTRVLPLNVRGAWVDILLNMWKSETRGVLIETIEEYSRMLSCTQQECDFALNLLMQKKTCDFEILADGKIKLISRRMVRDFEISSIRSKSGKNGVDAKKNKSFADSFAEAKLKQNTDIDNDINNDTDIVLKDRVQGKETFYSIEHCLTVALIDSRWTKANKTNKYELEEFNKALEQQGIYEKNPAEYKSHFANWKNKGKLTIIKNENNSGSNKNGIAGPATSEQYANWGHK